MESMLSTIWLILMALAFGSILDFTGMLRALLQPVINFATTTGRLFLSVVTTGFGINVLTADQYIAIALPGRIFAKEFRKRELAPVNLSRLIGDSSTVTSALVPWNTCGAYMAVTLGVGTFSYLPYCFFNIANPIISILVGALGIKIAKIAADGKKTEKVELTSPPGS
jgi:NhaC family Na+:H+ antiporter